MFLRCKKRRKDGKEHLYWSIVENRRVMGGRILQRHVLYLGELNGCQEASWRRTVELFDHDNSASTHSGRKNFRRVGKEPAGTRSYKPLSSTV